MVNQEIINYIKSQLSQGRDETTVRQLLLAHNWQAADVDEAFKAINLAPTPPAHTPVAATLASVSTSTQSLPPAENSFPFLWIGLGAMLAGFVITFFSGGFFISLIPNILISLVGIGVMAGLAKLFKVPGKVFAKTIFILGVSGLIGSIYTWLNGAVTMPSWVVIILAISLFIGGFFLIKMVYGIGWGKAIGLWIVNFIAMLITIFVALFLSGLLFAALLFGTISNSQPSKSNDDKRLSDLSMLNSALAYYITDSSDNRISCVVGKVYSSTNGTTAVDGTGWLPVNFNKITRGSPLSALPIDPLNNSQYYYSYACNSDTQTYELNAILRDSTYVPFSVNDGGNNPNLYEIGTDPGLDLIK